MNALPDCSEVNDVREMKDSGVVYLSTVPAHWQAHPVYYYFGERKNKNILLQEQNLLSLSYGRIVRKDINTSEGLLPASYNTYNIVEKNDIVIRPTDLQNDKRSLRTGLVNERGIITSAYIALMPIRPLLSSYFAYQLHAFDVEKVFYNMGNGVRQGLNYSEFSRLMVFEPPMTEQHAIADFLDGKCAEIDQIAANVQAEIEILEEYQDRLFHALTEFFHKTLASYHMDRYQDTSDVIMQLQKMLSLADETKPWLHSTSIQSIPAFYGREAEMCDLSQFLSENDHHTCSLYGMGGIGKSTLIRHYLSEHADDWDAHLWLYDKGNLMETLADDSQVLINTVTRENEETTDEYLKRKLVALGSLAKTQHILVVIDNFTYEHIDQLESLSKLCMTILLISRERLPEGLFPSMQVAEMEDNSLAGMFTYYSHCDLTDEDNFSCFQTIISIIDRHTLLTELIARQVAKSYLNLQVAEAMVAGIGLSDLPNEKIDYVRDQSAYHETLLKILDRLVEIDQFTEQDKLCMKLLSLFDMPGIEADLFKWMASLTSLDFVNDLETAGWLKAEQGRLYLHPMMQEYVRTWSWDKSSIEAADRMMQMLYERIRPAGTRHDGSKQFPKDYSSLYRLLKAADQLINHTEWISEASQRLLFRMLMDAPVDQDASVLFQMLDLLKDPRYLDDDSILRLYENAAYFTDVR